MIDITFYSHARTLDNETDVVSGHHDVALSAVGEEEAQRLGQRYKNNVFDAIFCSDLVRSYKTAELAFARRFPIIKDARLRECDYGEFTGKSKEIMKAERPRRITEPFPGGESYLQVISRLKSFLIDLAADYEGKRVMIIGHAGTRLGLEYWLNDIPLETAIANLKKQPGGTLYALTEIWPLRVDSEPLV